MNKPQKNLSGQKKNFLTVLYKAFLGFAKVSPVLASVVLFIGLFNVFVSKRFISSIFTGNNALDSVTGAVIGSISAGNPVTSYIIGGELLDKGISLFAVIAFIIAWVTVGIVQFPAEASILGKKFAFHRNLISFVLSIIIAIAAVYTLMLF
ncbi:MAG: permease [Elusimicrobiota bacterium]